MKKVAILSWSKQEELMATQEYLHHPVLKSWLEEQSKFQASDSRIILPEDRLLIAELAKIGIEAETVSWLNPDINWSDYGLCIVRTTWLWHANPEKFFKFTEDLANKVTLWNSVELMRWVSNKKYLIELAKKGVAITPSLSIPAKSAFPLDSIVAENNWEDFIVKPSTSQGARDVIRVSIHEKPNYKTLEEANLIFRKILESQDAIIQPYLNAVETEGEISVIVIDNKITHAVRRLPGPNSFLAIGYPLTKEELYPLDEEILAISQAILQKIPHPMHFGRFDFIRGQHNKLLLSEAELIAPRLFLQYSNAAINCLVASIKAVV